MSLLSKEIGDDWAILDVGCGRTSVLRAVHKGYYRVGLDIYRPYILKMRRLSIHDDYVLSDVRALPFKSKSFDCVVATEVLEHLGKKDGSKMLKEIERVARKKILMTTPNGFLSTHPGPDDNPDEAHLSGWTADELKELGFKVYGIRGLKALWSIKDGQAVIWLAPKRLPVLSAIIADVTGFFVYKNPHRAFQFFFVKDINTHGQN
jgi:ubiquinone/menaquinone biosynthesis C-methylase UbiE